MAETNPFYVGYYPGDRPFYKRPAVPEPNEAIQEDFTGLNQFLNDLDFQMKDMSGWLKEKYVDDFKNSFKVSVADYEYGGSADLALLTEEQVDALPGSIGISLDLYGLVTDPKKTLTKTAKSWTSAVFERADMNARASRTLWKAALSDPMTRDQYNAMAQKGPLHRIGAWSQLQAIEQIEKGIVREGGYTIDRSRVSAQPVAPGTIRKNPLSLDNQRVFSSDGEDLYAGVKGAVLDFQINAPSTASRERNYDTFLSSSFDALKAELDQGKEAHPDQTGTNQWNGLIEKVVQDDAARGIIRDQNFRGNSAVFLTSFDAKLDLLGSMTSTDKALKDASKALDAYILGISSGTDASGKTRNREKKALQQLGKLAKEAEKPDPVATALALISEDHGQAELRRAVGGFDDTMRDIADMTQAFREVNGSMITNSLSRDQALILRARIKRIQNGGRAQGVTGRVSELVRGAGISGGDVFFQGYRRKLLRHMRREVVQDREGHFTKNIIASITRNEDEDVSRSVKLQAIMVRTETDRSFHAMKEVADNVTDQKLLDRYVWKGRLKPSFDMLTPSYWVDKALSKVHHFGLIANDDAINFGSLNNGVDTFLKVIPLSARDGKPLIMGNWFKIKFQMPTVAGDFIVSAKVYGGSHFGLSKFFDKLVLEKDEHGNLLSNGLFDLSKDEDRLAMMGLLKAGNEADFRNILLGDFGKANPDMLAEILKVHPDDLQKYFAHLDGSAVLSPEDWAKLEKRIHNKVTDFWGKDDGSVIGWMQKRDEFRTWLEKNPKMFKKLVDGKKVSLDALTADELDALMLGTLGGLRKRRQNLLEWGVLGRLDIDRKYVGYLEKVGGALNRLQAWVGKQGIAGRFFVIYVNVRTIIVEGISDAIAHLLAVLGGAATGGAAAGLIEAVMKVVKPLLRFVVGKIYDFTQKFFVDGLLKGNVSKVFQGVEEALSIVIKTLLLIMGGFLMFFLLIYVFFASLLGTIPLVRDTVFGGGGYSPGDSSGGVHFSCNEPVLATPNNCVYRGSYEGLQGSYTPESAGDPDGSGHGSNEYWTAVGGFAAQCSFLIPTGYLLPTGAVTGSTITPLNVCHYAGDNPQAVYGFARDVAPTAGECSTVYIPEFAGVTSWYVSSVSSSTYGLWVTLTGTAADGTNYRMVLGHLAGAIQTGVYKSPGEAVGETLNWPGNSGNSHTHIELAKVDGGGTTALRPEDYLCP